MAVAEPAPCWGSPVVAPGDSETVASFPASRAGLNIAEIQLCVLLQQCLDQRIPAATTLTTELQALQEQRPISHSQFMW